MNGSLPNFEDIAKQLQSELQKRSVPEGSEAPMPPVDAPGSQQPIQLSTGNNDMPKVVLRHAPTSQECEIYFYGAVLTSWKTRGEDHFWLSSINKWVTGGKAIRGGIPICFPQFGPYGDLAQHGFARDTEWELKESFVADDTSVTAVFSLSSEKATEAMAKWPFKFSVDYTVTLSVIGLETKLSVKNTDDKPITFTCAFHNYFKATSIKNVRVFGFEERPYLDRLNGDAEMAGDKDEGSGMLIEKEVDRIYKNAPDELAIFDFGNMKVLKIKTTPTFGDTTLWNPYGAEGADAGWDNFICIEPACVTNPATLQPGETWVGAQLLGVE